MKKKKDKVIYIQVDEDFKEVLKKAAENAGADNLSAWVRQVLKEAASKHLFQGVA